MKSIDRTVWIGIGESEEAFLKEWNNGNDYVVAHTSGSTGIPKEIKLLKKDMLQSARNTNKRFGICKSSTLLSPLSADYIAGKMMIVRAIDAGCILVLEQPSNSPLKEDYGEIDLLAVVPSQCHALMQNPTAHKRLRNVIVGGAPMSSELEAAMVKMPWRTYATYGMTETCSHVALRQCGNEYYEAMPGIQFSNDARACLVVEAPQFSFDRLVTNDVVDINDYIHFKWLGRYDNVINSGGVKFFPEQLEKLLEGKLPKPFYISAINDKKWGEAVGITLLEGSADEKSVISICKEVLPPYAVPKHVRFVEKMDYTRTGKLRRNMQE